MIEWRTVKPGDVLRPKWTDTLWTGWNTTETWYIVLRVHIVDEPREDTVVVHMLDWTGEIVERRCFPRSLTETICCSPR